MQCGYSYPVVYMKKFNNQIVAEKLNFNHYSIKWILIKKAHSVQYCDYLYTTAEEHSKIYNNKQH